MLESKPRSGGLQTAVLIDEALCASTLVGGL
jgi:hypothetical protein